MPTEPAKANNWLPLIAAGVLAFLLWNKQPVVPPAPPGPIEPTVESVVSKVIPAYKANYAAAWSEAAVAIRNKELVSDRLLLEFLKPRMIAARSKAEAEFNELLEKTIPSEIVGKEAAVSDFLEKVAKSW